MRLKLAVLLCLFLGAVSNASGQCGQQVSDGAGVFGAGTTRVQDAVNKLTSETGAEVYVFTIHSMGSAPSLKEYVIKLIETCPAWQASDGRTKLNLIVVANAVSNRKTAIIYGDQWKPSLDPAVARIQESNMNPRFKAGDTAGGFVAGLTEINRLTMAQLHPPVQSAPTPLPAATPAPAQPSTTTNVDFSSFGRFLFYIFLLIAVGIGLYALYRVVGQLITARAKKRLAQHQAVVAKQETASRVVEADRTLSDLRGKIESLSSGVSESDLKRARNFFTEAESRYASAMSNFGFLGQTSVDPEKSSQTTGQYEAIGAKYNVILNLFHQMDDSCNGAKKELRELETLVENGPEQVSMTTTAVESAASVLLEVKQRGLKVERAQLSLDKANSALLEAKTALGALCLKDATKLCSEAQVSAMEAITSAQDEVKTRDRIENAIKLFEEALGAVPAQIQSFEQKYNDLLRRFGTVNLRVFTDHATLAGEHVSGAKLELGKAKARFATGDFATADKRLAAANKRLQMAAELLGTIDQAGDQLKKADIACPILMRKGQKKCEEISSYLSEHAAVLGTVFDGRLNALRSTLGDINAYLEIGEVGLLSVFEQVTAVNQRCEKLLEDATAEVARVETERKDALDSLREAELNVRKFSQYCQRHKLAGLLLVKKDMAGAEKALRDAQNASLACEQKKHAATASKHAVKGLTKAKEHVEEKEASRRSKQKSRAQRRSSGDSNIILIPEDGTSVAYEAEIDSGLGSQSSSPSRSSSPGRSSSSGGSSDWGSSRGGSSSGGSSDWGGSSGGGYSGGDSSWGGGSSDSGGGSSGGDSSY